MRRHVPPARTLLLAMVFTAVWVHLALVSHPRAEFIQRSFTDKPERFGAMYGWTFPDSGADDAGPFTGDCGDGRKCWTVELLISLSPREGKRTLDVFPKHAPGERPADPGHGANTGLGTLVFSDVTRPGAGQPIVRTLASANRIEHGRHSDYFIGILKVPRAGNLEVRVEGEHQGPLKPFEASFTNFTDRPLQGAFKPSYDFILGDDIPFGPVQPGASVKKELPKRRGKDPTDYLVVASGSGVTETTLTFLGPARGISGIIGLELAPVTELLLGDGAFLVPMLRDPGEASDLFVFVDLLQWLAAEAGFSPLQEFDMADGLHDLLPGIFVSTSPITVRDDGSLQGTPFTGRVLAAGGIDGRAAAIPGPSTSLLVLAGFAGLFAPAIAKGRLGSR